MKKFNFSTKTFINRPSIILLRVSKIIKKTKKQKKLEERCHKLFYEEIVALQEFGRMMCGYLKKPLHDGENFYGLCALTEKNCKYNKPSQDTVSCSVYKKYFKK